MVNIVLNVQILKLKIVYKLKTTHFYYSIFELKNKNGLKVISSRYLLPKKAKKTCSEI